MSMMKEYAAFLHNRGISVDTHYAMSTDERLKLVREWKKEYTMRNQPRSA